MIKKFNGTRKIISVLVFIAIIICLFFVVWWLTNNGDEIYISSGALTNKTHSLNCVSTNPKGAFFSSDALLSVHHNIKIIFKNGDPYSISYVFDGVYPSEQQAKVGEATLHVYYGKYMADSGNNSEILSPVFSISGAKVNILLFTEWKKLNSTVSKIFLVKEGELDEVNTYTVDDFMHFYKNKGFICTIK